MIGNGKQCIEDSDSDGIPDSELTTGCDSVQEYKCKAVCRQLVSTVIYIPGIIFLSLIYRITVKWYQTVARKTVTMMD